MFSKWPFRESRMSMKKLMRVAVVAAFSFGPSSVYAAEEQLSCPLLQAVYKPHIENLDQDLNFTMTITTPYPDGPARHFYIHGFDSETNDEVSAFRMSLFSTFVNAVCLQNIMDT